jgi:hypothetical protein
MGSAQVEWKRRRIASGLCACGNTPEPGKKSCRGCIDRRSQHTKALREARRERGVCPDHPDMKPAPGNVYCEICLRYHKDRHIKLITDGKCIYCLGEARPHRKTCKECTDKAVAKNVERKAMRKRNSNG